MAEALINLSDFHFIHYEVETRTFDRMEFCNILNVDGCY